MATFAKGYWQHKTDAHNDNVAKRLKRTLAEPTTPSERAFNITATQLLNRDGPHCYLCQSPLPANFEIDHILPRSRGGTNHPNNLALTCKSCNSRKSNHYVSIRIADRIPCYWRPT